MQQTYQFNFLATISAALKKEAHIIHKYRCKSRLIKFIPHLPNLQENMAVLVHEYKKSKITYFYGVNDHG